MDIKIIMQEFIINYGLISVFIIVALEYANFPLPSEIILTGLGMIAAKYDMNIISILIVSVLGGLAGSILNYYIGLKLGRCALEKMMMIFPRSKNSIKKSYKFICKYDKTSVCISRIIPVARTVISIVAGVVDMNLFLFTIYSAIGITLWNTVLIFVGYIVEDNLTIIIGLVKKYSLGISFLILIILAIYLLNKFVKSKKNTSL